MSSKIFCKSWGAEYIAADVVRFRLWATGQQKVMLRLAGKDQEMQANGDGWFTLDVSGVTPGTEYNFVLSDGMVVPDPASRAQKTDVNGPSYVVDPGSYAWRNTGWKGSRWGQAVVYEMHTGTFTPEGTPGYCAEPFRPGRKLFTAIGAGVFPQRAHDAVGKWYRL